jgi:hypothetical protein
MNPSRFYQITRWLAVLTVLFSGLALGMFAFAQDDGDEEDFVPVPIELYGTISDIDGTVITVSGLPVEISAASVDGSLAVGLVIDISGTINEEGIIVAHVIVVVGTSTPEPEVTETPEPEATEEPVDEETDEDAIIVIEGPVQNININVITIYNINISVAPQNPILNLIQIGDVVRVEGMPGSNGLIHAIVVNTLVQSENAAPDASVSVQGPIEGISGNTIVVNGITIQLDPSDPQLHTLSVGDFIDAQGNFVLVNNTYVLVVVNVVIINNTFVGVPPFCTWHGMGMGMGHWRCDGYWLYPSGYWNCEWRGMGMGMGRWDCRNPAPGMGMGMGR